MKENKQPAKKFLMIFVVILIFGSWVGLLAETVMFSVSGGYLFPSDSGYKEIYGHKVIIPEFKLGIRVFKEIYIYGSFYSFSKSGLTPQLQEPASSKQQFFGGGLGYFPNLGKHWKLFLGAEVMAATYREEAMETIVSGHRTGFSVEGGIYLKEKFMILGINGAYTSASGSYEGASFKLGGSRASVALGFVF
ncbi:MAG: hypothetical protein ACPLZD_00785 [Candidatus Saccharicenans sp.]|nr:MAG: hypothetical protein C0168_01545 [Candidatus Aminicenantes bacterium]HEK85144.1 hypothetical protein [Candidatus Aminicenantes bacterium]